MQAKQIFHAGFVKGMHIVWDLGKVMVPAIMLVALLERTGMLARVAIFFAPVMGWFGLPGEAAVALVVGWITSLYGGIGAILALPLAPKQFTVICTMVALCHGMIIESAVIAKAGANAVLVFLIRLAAACLAGLFLSQVL